MQPETHQILPLPVEVAAQVKSSTAIPSQAYVVVGLVENALDASAHRIEVSVDFRRGSCSVEDDGCGIPSIEFSEIGGLGKPHYTSKHDQSATVHGSHGTFLSSLAALSILTITSHHHSCQSHSTLVLHHSRPAARLIPAPTRHSLLCREHGTRVHVQDLFGNMPVRVKQRALISDGREQERLWEKLVQRLVALILAWSLPVTLVLKNPEGVKKLLIRGRGNAGPISLRTDSGPGSFDISLVRSILSHAGYVEPSDWNKWVETSAVTSSISVRGIISLQPAPSKRVQFISLGIRQVDPDLNKIMYEEVNQIFASSDFGKETDSSEPERESRRRKGKRLNESEITVKKPRGGGKGADRWPMFFIRINLLSGPKVRLKGDLDNVGESVLLRISSTLRAMIVSFLKDHHFRPHIKRARLHEKADDGLSQSDRPAAESQNMRNGLPTMASADLVPSVETCTLAVGSSIHPNESEQICVGSTLKDSVSRSSHSQNPQYRGSYSDHGFSTWSRIKSGKREELDKLLSHESVSGRKQEPHKDDDTEDNLTSAKDSPYTATESAVEASKKAGEQKDHNENTEVNGFGEAEYIPADGAPLSENSIVTSSSENDQISDEVIQWTNPVTGATVFLSTRTGLEVRRRLTQPGSLSTLESKTSHPRKAKMMKPKLVPSSSDPFSQLKEGSWVSELLKNWNNPVFKTCEESIPLFSFGSLDGASSNHQAGRAHSCSEFSLQKAFTESSSLSAAKLSKEALCRSKLIAQVDQKYLLVCMDVSRAKGALEDERLHSQRCLVLIDQHAADERIRVEGLLAEVCRGPSPEARSVPAALVPQSAIATLILPQPISFAIHQRDAGLFTADAVHFAEWGILYSVEPRTEKDRGKSVTARAFQLIVRALPEAIAERCRADPPMLLDLLRTEVWRRKDGGLGPKVPAQQTACSPSSSTKTAFVPVDDAEEQPRPGWLRRVGNCPQGMLDMINSRACRSAIMFNDSLTREECRLLLRKLSRCAFPFQCAHGRPSMIPLVGMGDGEGEGGDGLGIARGLLGSGDREERRDLEGTSGAAWRGWMERRNKDS